MRYSEKICKRVLIFLDVGQDQDQTDQIWSRNWKSHAGKIPAASGSQPLKKGVFPFNGSKKSRIKKSRCNQKSLFACPFTTQKNFWNSVKNAALTTKRRISGAVGYIPPPPPTWMPHGTVCWHGDLAIITKLHFDNAKSNFHMLGTKCSKKFLEKIFTKKNIDVGMEVIFNVFSNLQHVYVVILSLKNQKSKTVIASH